MVTHFKWYSCTYSQYKLNCINCTYKRKHVSLSMAINEEWSMKLVSVTKLASVLNRTSNIVDKSRYCAPKRLMWLKLIDWLLIKGKNNKTFLV